MVEEKKERVWNDLVIDTPKLSADRLWRVRFIGGINMLMGFILYVVINFSDVPVEFIPSIFLCVGGAFLLIGSYIYRKRSI